MVSSHVGLSMQRYLIVDPPSIPDEVERLRRDRLRRRQPQSVAVVHPLRLGRQQPIPSPEGRTIASVSAISTSPSATFSETRCRPFFNLANTSGVEAFYNVAVPP